MDSEQQKSRAPICKVEGPRGFGEISYNAPRKGKLSPGLHTVLGLIRFSTEVKGKERGEETSVSLRTPNDQSNRAGEDSES